ncbi:hypothetical protein [Nostoc sp. LEGE 06077]|nr:hypothetical protein [Nostoc sp. LEGE 06077]
MKKSPDVRGQEATSLIQVFDSLSGVEAQEYAQTQDSRIPC